MANVYVEPKPKSRPEGTQITHYVLEHAHGVRVTNTNYGTQGESVAEAKTLGIPLDRESVPHQQGQPRPLACSLTLRAGRCAVLVGAVSVGNAIAIDKHWFIASKHHRTTRCRNAKRTAASAIGRG